MTSQPQTLQEGSRFADRYSVGRLLGRGGMGEVYAVHDEQVREDVALKTLINGVIPQVVERFRREVRLARRVTSRNVARIFDLGEHDGLFFLTMELIDGEPLRARLRDSRPWPPAERWEVARQITEALAVAHEAGVLHRDLKPGNILLERGGRVVLTDFGIARTLDHDDEQLTHGILGTPRYMAPEQLTGGAVDARTDLYALGLILKELAEAPGPLLDLGTRLAQLDPNARPASAREVLKEIQAGAAPQPPQPSQPPQPPIEEATVVRSPGSPASISLFAPIPETEESLVVLPFTARGGDEARELAAVVGDEIVGILARTRGLRVLSPRTVANPTGDPREIGASLGVQYVVAGVVSSNKDRIRVQMSTVEVRSGEQIFSERFEGQVEDLFAFEDQAAHRMAELLRVELKLMPHRGQLGQEAALHYQQGRRKLRDPQGFPTDSGVTQLEQAILLSPDFKPALALHAVAAVRRFFTASGPQQQGWGQEAQGSVERALRLAPELAESHLAAGLLSSHLSDYRSAARALHHALDIAPTLADAHELLGRLECEAGRVAEGVRRIEFAASLDPAMMPGLIEVTRQRALAGDLDGARALTEQLVGALGDMHFALLLMRIRLSLWRGDRDSILTLRDRIPRSFGDNTRVWLDYTEAALGWMAPEAFVAALSGSQRGVHNPRRRTMLHQLAAEALGAAGAHDAAAAQIEAAAREALIDIGWLERCPLLASLQHRPDVRAARELTRARAEAIWFH
jgi:serine/threonine-protein kinase